MARNELRGPNLEGYSVGSWCPTTDGTGQPTAVAITLHVSGYGDLVLRLKSERAVDEMCKLLQEYKEEVWPPASDGQHVRKS